MITLKDLTLQRGIKLIFDHVALTIFAKQKIGLVGINGCGKSSFFAMLLGQLQPDSGDLFIQSNIRIAHLSQEIPNTDISAIQYTLHGDKELSSVLKKLMKAEKNQDAITLAKCHTQLYEIDGYTAESRAAKLLNGLGFMHHEHNKAVNEFSGGWRMRLNLAQVLMRRSDLLLLDEPTNHLDMDAIIWLEYWLQKYNGTLILVSHDREFLDNVIHKVIYIHNCKLNTYSGNYSSFEEQRAEQLSREQVTYLKQQAQIDHMTKFVNRFRAKATKARQAQSRLKALERMKKATITHINSPFSFTFHKTMKCSAPLLKLEKAGFSYNENIILTNVNFSLNPGDRIGLLGVNGAGKSTFIKLLDGILKPKHGTIFTNKQLKIGYFAQHQVDQLNNDESAFFHIMHKDETAHSQKVRDFLGSFGFRNNRVFESIKNFSGGEKARLALAILVWQQPNLLLLDEPTNHLDLDMRETLTYALQDFTGALIVVSHDRHLLRSTVNEFYLVHDQKVSKFDGDLSDYQTWLFKLKKQQTSEYQEVSRTATSSIQKKTDKQNKPSNEDRKQIKQLESKLKQLYNERKKIEDQLAESDIYQTENKNILQKQIGKLEKIKHDINLLEEEWLELGHKS